MSIISHKIEKGGKLQPTEVYLTLDAYSSDGDGSVMLTATCVSVKELEAEGERLKSAIDAAIAAGKRALKPR